MRKIARATKIVLGSIAFAAFLVVVNYPAAIDWVPWLNRH